MIKQGVLIFDEDMERYDIRFDAGDFYGGLHCGECFDVHIKGRWKPTRIEMGTYWYLVNIHTDKLPGLCVRMNINRY